LAVAGTPAVSANRLLLRDRRLCHLRDCGSRAGCAQKFAPAYCPCHVVLPCSAFVARFLRVTILHRIFEWAAR
jgi:hypothetical protein